MWMRKNDLFMLSRVKIIGKNILTDEEIIELADIDFSQEIFNVNLSIIEDRLLTNPLIKKVDVSRYMPSALKIIIEEYNLIANVSYSELCAIDIEGQIVKTDKIIAVYDLPVITGTQCRTDAIGRDVASLQMYEMVKILTELREKDFKLFHDISEVNYNKDIGYILYLRKNTIPVILGFENYSKKIKYFSTIYDVLQKQEKLLASKTIDIRFDGQVVVRN